MHRSKNNLKQYHKKQNRSDEDDNFSFNSSDSQTDEKAIKTDDNNQSIKNAEITNAIKKAQIAFETVGSEIPDGLVDDFSPDETAFADIPDGLDDDEDEYPFR